MPSDGGIWKRLRSAAFAPVDIASVVFFRIVFGSLLAWHVVRYFVRGNVATFWIEPRFFFKFYGFSWVQPWPNQWLYLHWGALGIFALFVAFGFCYRASSILLFLSYAYFFLLDQARYVNHSYLACLFCFLLIFIPAHRAFSVDARLRPGLRATTVPAWNVWLLRFQMGVVYFFAGVAKISPDWLRGEPMRVRLANPRNFALLGTSLRGEWAVYAASYGAMLLDLLIVPFLLWPKTRVPAFCLVVAFHLMNWFSFPLEFFPWLAIAGTAMFFPPDWPRRAFGWLGERRSSSKRTLTKTASPLRQKIVLALLAVYAAIQIVLPLRAFLTPGGITWNYSEHLFSWRMMVISQGVRGSFYVTDPNNGQTAEIALPQFLDPRQRAMIAFVPDFTWQAAHYLATTLPRSGPQSLRVEARLLISINGRKPQPYVIPDVDLAAQPRPFLRPAWLNEINDPLPPLAERYRAGFSGLQ